MNYLGEINAFERWLESNSLEPAPQLLMYKFYKLANRACWPEWVQVENLDLMAEMKTKREATIIAWRDKLIEKGLLEYRKGKKGNPNRYKITSLYTSFKEAQIAVQAVVKSEVQVVANTAVSYKQKQKTKTNGNAREKKEASYDMTEIEAMLNRPILEQEAI